jgi:superfamily II DNA or RNA helicase
VIWNEKTFWPHQEQGLRDLFAATNAGRQRIVFTSPTGGGKTLMLGYATSEFIRAGKTVDILTNRRLLLSQLCSVFDGYRIPYAVRAAELDHLADISQPVQFVMVQTELSRRKRRANYKQRTPDVVFVDEAHNLWGGGAGELLQQHVADGASAVSVTATPVGCPTELGDHLIVAGKTSELRACGALLLCRTFEPDVPRGILQLKPTPTGEFLESGVVKAIMSPTIHARVLEWLLKINPDLAPTILFGPNVAGSIYFAEQLTKAGVRSAHIDGDKVWLDGFTYPSTPELRDEVLQESRKGTIKVLCNRFVLREGIDAPWLKHCILATAFGSVTSYIQSVGRLLRAYPGMSEVTLQDHGGNFRRHGSPNADRHWVLGQDANDITRERHQACREKKENEGIVCPVCGAIRLWGPACITCGHRSEVHGRYVVEKNGSLRFVKGDVYSERKTKQTDKTQKQWDRCYWGFRKAGKTFNQAYGWFFKKHRYWPPKTLGNMPKTSLDWLAPIDKVPRKDLIPSPEVVQKKTLTLFD